MPRQRHHIHVFKVDRDVPERLHRVGVERHLMLRAYRGKLRGGLDGACLVVHRHYRDTRGIGGEGGFEVGGADDALPVNGQINDVEPVLFKPFQRFKYSVMLESGSDDAALSLLTSHGRGGKNGGIVALGAAAREEHLAGLTAEYLRARRPRLVQRDSALPAEGIHRGRVAVALAEPRQHCFEHSVAYTGGGGVVKIYGSLAHNGSLKLPPSPFSERAVYHYFVSVSGLYRFIELSVVRVYAAPVLFISSRNSSVLSSVRIVSTVSFVFSVRERISSFCTT